jgi:DNA-binding transcriptional ArsR family regulator
MTSEPACNIFLIKDRETLKVIADPLRGQILDALRPEPLTVKQVADRLGLAPSKLYYHINMLEKYGFIHVAETRQVANMIEKTFQAVASQLDIAPALLTTATEEGKDSVYEMVKATLDTTREDILRSLQARYTALEQGAAESPRCVVLNRQVGVLTDERAAEFNQRLQSLIQEFETLQVPAGTPDSLHYGLSIAFYPSFYYQETLPHD